MKTQPKISLLVSDLSSAALLRAYLIATALKILECESEIIGFLFGETLYRNLPPELNIQILPGKNFPNFFTEAKKILPQITGDIIYAIKPQIGSFGVALLKKIFSKKPVILDIDDWEMSWYGGDEWHYHPTIKQLARDILKPDGALRNPYHPFYIKLMESWTKKADVITVHNQFLQKRFGGMYVPNGKDINLFDPTKFDPEASRNRYGLSGYRILMFPGAPRPYKGLEDILTALEKINQPDIKLVIVGGSPYDDYDQQLQEKWGNWIIKLPKYPADAMPDIIATAHIIVVPQRDTITTRAQFPLKLTDGMAMAKPILSTRVGDIPEILGETGYLVDPGDPEQIAEQIQVIFQDLNAANAKGAQARKRCVEKYSLEAMANALKTVLTSL